MGTTLYDQSGAAVDVPDAQVTQKLISGELGTDKAKVTVKSQSGKVYEVPTENLAKFNESMGGVHVLNSQQIAEHEAHRSQEAQQEKYGGLGHQVAAGAISAADALTLGLGTGAAGALGGEQVKNYIRSVEAANPISSGLGTALGLVVPALLTGGGSLLEEGATGGLGLLARTGEALAAPTRALGALGEAGAAGTRSLLGEGVAGRLVGGAVRGSLEGAVYGANTQISEDVIHDHELTAERMLAGAGHGALWGGGLGLGFSGLGLAAEKGVQGLAKVSEGGLGEKIARRAEEMQFTATGAKTPEIRRATATNLETNEIGRWMLDVMPGFAEDGKAPISREGILKAANNAIEDATPKISGHIDSLDQLGARPDGEAVIERLRRELIDPLDKKLGMEAVTSRLTTIVDKAQGRLEANPTFRELFDLRKELDDLAYRDRKVLDQSNAMKELRNARGMLEDEIGKQGEAFAGPEWKKGYDASKKQFQMAKTVADATISADKRIAGNRAISLSDTIMASHGLGALATGHPLGVAVGLGGAVLNHLIRDYGDAVGSRLLDKLSKIDAVRSLDSQFAGDTAEAVRRFMSSGHVAAVGTMVKLPGKFEDKKEEIDKLSSHPEVLAAAMGRHLPTEAPKVSAAMVQKAQAAVQYLKSTMPQGIATGSTFTPQLTQKPSKRATHEWMQQVDVWENPLGVVHDMQKGALSPGKADALKTIYPKIFDDIQKNILGVIVEKAAKGHQVSYKARVQMGVLFGMATDATMTPEFVQSQQALYANGAPKEQGLPPSPLTTRAPATAAKMQLEGPQRIGTEAQRLEENHGIET